MITVEKIHHKGEYRIAVHFPREQNLIDKLRAIPGTLWSQSKSTWHIPYSKDAYNNLLVLFPGIRPVPTETKPKPAQLEQEKSNGNSYKNLYPAETKPKPTQIEQEKSNGNSYKDLYPKGDECNIFFYGSRILIFIRKELKNTNFLKGLKGIFFDKEKKCWSLANEGNNLLLLEKHFETRLKRKNYPPERLISPAVKRLMVRDEGVIRIISNGNRQIKLYFNYNKEVVKFVKSIPYAGWNESLMCWMIPHTEVILKEIKMYFEGLKFRIEYREEKEKKREPLVFKPKFRDCPKEYLDKLELKRYSTNTIRVYMGSFKEFINFYPDKSLNEITESEIKEYMLHLVQERKVVSS